MLNLDYLKQIANGEMAQVKELLTTFFLVTQEDITNLKSAINNQQHSLVASISHRIKGAAIIVGARELAALTADLETCGSIPDPDRYAQLCTKIENSFQSLKSYANNLPN